ncbi:MAG: cell division protein SepF [Defluviitaleaceae bacterium]|nr:cell division protein SepF [Defluviitaleaceae bacterium]
MAFFQKVKDFIFQAEQGEDTYQEIVEHYDYPVGDDIETIASLRNAREERRNTTGDTRAITPKKQYGKDESVIGTIFPNENAEILMAYPQSIEDSGPLSTILKEGKGIIVKLETLEAANAQRIMDFLSGVVHTLDGGIKEITNRVFMLTPKGMELSDMHRDTLAKNGLLPTAANGKLRPFSRRDR